MIIEIPKDQARGYVCFCDYDYQPRFTDGDRNWFFSLMPIDEPKPSPYKSFAEKPPRYIAFIQVSKDFLVQMYVRDGLEIAYQAPWRSLVEDTNAYFDTVNKTEYEQAADRIGTVLAQLKQQPNVYAEKCDKESERHYRKLVRKLKEVYADLLDPLSKPHPTLKDINMTAKKKPAQTQQQQKQQPQQNKPAQRQPAPKQQQPQKQNPQVSKTQNKPQKTASAETKPVQHTDTTEQVYVVVSNSNPVIAFKEHARAVDLIDSMKMVAEINGDSADYDIKKIPLRA